MKDRERSSITSSEKKTAVNMRRAERQKSHFFPGNMFADF